MVLSGKKKIADIKDINDGRNWCKKKFATNNFPGCTNRYKYYQDCNGYFTCPNSDCVAKKLFSKVPTKLAKACDKPRASFIKCYSCDTVMQYNYCKDETIRNNDGQSPTCRRYLDFDYCHEKLTVKGSSQILSGCIYRKFSPNNQRNY